MSYNISIYKDLYAATILADKSDPEIANLTASALYTLYFRLMTDDEREIAEGIGFEDCYTPHPRNEETTQ